MLGPTLDAVNDTSARELANVRRWLEQPFDSNAVHEDVISASYLEVKMHQFVIERVISCRLRHPFRIQFLPWPSFQLPSYDT